MLIRFIRDAIYETEGPGKGPRFEAGSVHDMRLDLAQRWINRGMAEPHEIVLSVPEPALQVEPESPMKRATSRRLEQSKHQADHNQ